MTVLASTVFSGSPSGTDVGLVQVADLTVSANVLGNTTFGIDASAGAVRATLPPATGSGDRIVITADDVTNAAEIASGDSLNGEALGSIFPALNDVVYLVDAKVGDWTGRILQAPTVTPVDEFNSNAVVTSTVLTMSFTDGDLTFTDPLNVETWFAGPAVDATAVGGSASQYAGIIDDNYTLLVVAGPTAITDSPYIVWFSGLNNGDTIEAADPAFSDISAVGAGTLTGADQVTADGTGFVGIQVTGVGGLTLTLSGATMHMFAEIPLPVPATGLDLGRKTTAERDALTGLTGGEHLYNTTTETRQWYHPGSGGQTVSYDSTGGPVGGSGINAESTERGQTVPYQAFASQFQTIDLGLASTTATSDVQVTAYDGVGLGGTVLGQQTITVPVSTPGISQYETVNFPSPVLIPSGAGNFTIGVVRVAGTGGTQFWLSDDYLPGGGNLTLSNALDHSMVLTLTEQGATPAEWRDYPTTGVGEAPGIDTFDASLITHSGAGTFAPNVTNPATGQISVSDGTIERHGTWATYRFRMEFDQDGLFTLDFAGIIPAGSSIVMAYPWGDAAAEEPFSDVNFNANGTTAIDFNRADSIDADVNYKVTMVVDGYPEVRSLAPGDVPVQALDSVVGWADIGDILVPGTPTFSSMFSNVTANAQAGSTWYEFTLAAPFADSNYNIQFSMEERTLGVGNLAINDWTVPQVAERTASGWRMLFEETSGAGQDLRVNFRCTSTEAQTSVIPTDATVVTEWTAYAPTIVSETASLTLPTDHHLDGWFKRVGDSLHLKVDFGYIFATGGVNGTGARLFSIPAGFTINTAVATPGYFRNASAQGLSGMPLGSGYVFTDTAAGIATIYAHDTTTVKANTTTLGNATDLWGNAWYSLGVNNGKLSFTAEIPVL